MKVEYQHNPGWKSRFDYPGLGLRITLDSGEVIHLHHDADNGPALSYLNPKTGEWLEAEGNRVKTKEGDVEATKLDEDWLDYWYVSQKWRTDPKEKESHGVKSRDSEDDLGE